MWTKGKVYATGLNFWMRAVEICFEGKVVMISYSGWDSEGIWHQWVERV